MNPKINVLIRHKFRPELFKRCIESVRDQTIVKDLNVIICCDSKESRRDAEQYLDKFQCTTIVFDALIQNEYPFYWNLYSNQLKALVESGWFFYLDDDDFLLNNFALENIQKHLINSDEAIICQMLRKGRAKPPPHYIENKIIERGKIGAPCLFLHSKHKNLVDWECGKGADYKWIKEVSRKIEIKFVPLVVVRTGNNGLHGK